METVVVVSARAKKDLERVPDFIQRKLKMWATLVERQGMSITRTSKGFHDEPLKDDRAGQRSIRLNQAYRAIYTMHRDGTIELVTVEEVHKHDY